MDIVKIIGNKKYKWYNMDVNNQNIKFVGWEREEKLWKNKL